MNLVETMTYYSVQFLGDFAAFLLTEPIIMFIGLFVVLVAVGVVSSLVFMR